MIPWQIRAQTVTKDCEECSKVFGPRKLDNGTYEGEISFKGRRFCGPGCASSNQAKERYKKEQAMAAEREARKERLNEAMNRFLYAREI